MVSLSVGHWKRGDDDAEERVVGMGGNGSRGVRTTIEGVVRIPGVGGFPCGTAEEGGIGI